MSLSMSVVIAAMPEAWQYSFTCIGDPFCTRPKASRACDLILGLRESPDYPSGNRCILLL